MKYLKAEGSEEVKQGERGKCRKRRLEIPQGRNKT